MKRVAITKKKTTRLKDYEAEFEAMKPLVHARSHWMCEAIELARQSPLYVTGDTNGLFDGCTLRSAHVHHRKIRKQGGTNGLDNLLDTCLNCHTWIHANPELAFKLRLLVHEWESEAL